MIMEKAAKKITTTIMIIHIVQRTLSSVPVLPLPAPPPSFSSQFYVLLFMDQAAPKNSGRTGLRV